MEINSNDCFPGCFNMEKGGLVGSTGGTDAISS